ncbi:MAG: GTPase HflX [Clostridia bacterium]|nr:GTPase HflX [Clostridia bacterium]
MEQANLFRSEEAPRAVLVSVITPDMDQKEAAVSLDELEKLLETAGGTLFAQVIQQRQTPVAATYIGTGKLEEIRDLCQASDIHLVVFDCELSPAQIKNVENALEDGKDDFEVRVIDRSMLILDIFALHATTGEGKLQVELAQLRYTIPRLIGRGTELSRLGGGIGTRGPGESKLETDRRHVQRRISALEAQIAEMEANRQVQRAKRERSGILKVAIVGYTNAGKSTLLNRLTDAGILAENKLFATLDPTTRKFALPSGREILLTDTVGFIRNLPHHLIRAFRSTLEEAKFADAILILVDASDPEADSQLEVTEKLLYDLGAADKPILYVFNKCDVSTESAQTLARLQGRENVVAISALDGRGVPDLVDKLELLALGGKRMCALMIPMNKQGLIAQLYAASAVEDVEYLDDGVRVVALLDEKLRGRFKDYIVE